MLFLSLDVFLPPHQSHPLGSLLRPPPHRSPSWSPKHNELVFPLSNLEPWHRHSCHCMYPPVLSNKFLSTSSLDWKLSPQGQGRVCALSLQCLPQSLGWCKINGRMNGPMNKYGRFRPFQWYPPPPHRTPRAHVMPRKIPHLPLTSLRTPRVFPSATSPKETEPWLSWGMAWSHSGHPDPLP